MNIGVFPATDLHLLVGTTTTLTLRARWPDWREVSRFPGFTIALDPMPFFVSLANRTITATDVGTVVTRMKVAWNDAGGTLHGDPSATPG
jgi:hypothetical protein